MSLKNILAVRNDRFGEFLLNIPAFCAIKDYFKNPRLTVVINPSTVQLAKKIKSIDDIIIWENRRHSLGEIFHFIRQLRNKKFDACLILNPSQEMNIAVYLSGIPLRAGYDRKWGFLLNRKMKDRKHLGLKHEIDYNLELAGLIGATTGKIDYSIDIGNGIIQKDNLIAIHPWASDPRKQWPIENFVDLAKQCESKFGSQVVIVGKTSSQNNKLFDNLGEKIKNLTNQTTLEELGLLLKKSLALISLDSGPAHLAAAVGTPVIALFRNDLAGKTARRWGPWGKQHLIIEKSNLNDIKIAEVIGKIEELLKQ